MRFGEVRRFLRSFPPTHELLYLSRYVGLRDRFRCPGCGAVGTWKPHGGRLDQLHDRVLGQELPTRCVRRWVCKYCGRYEGPEGVLRAHPDSERPWWVLPPPHDPQSSEETALPTPREVLETGYEREVWPWRG